MQTVRLAVHTHTSLTYVPVSVCVLTFLPCVCAVEQIEPTLLEETVKTLNSYYAEAEKIGGQSYLEGCLACATVYIIFLCMETRYEKVINTRSSNCAGMTVHNQSVRYFLQTKPKCWYQVKKDWFSLLSLNLLKN